MGSIPGQGTAAPCAKEQLSPHLLKQKISHDSIEIPITETKTQGSQISEFWRGQGGLEEEAQDQSRWDGNGVEDR